MSRQLGMVLDSENMERLTLNNLLNILMDGLWTGPLEDSLRALRSGRKLDANL